MSREAERADEPTGIRPRRADATRNRELLLTAARQAFTAADDDSTVSLDAIARSAGVGIGTLYRNFPTRVALIEALYRSELDEVIGSAAPLLDGRPAVDALRAWMDRYAGFVATKQGMPNALRAASAAGSLSMGDTRRRVVEVMTRMLDAGAADGSIRHDVTPDDVTDILVGTFLAAGRAGDTARTTRLLDMLVDGVRPPQHGE